MGASDAGVAHAAHAVIVDTAVGGATASPMTPSDALAQQLAAQAQQRRLRARRQPPRSKRSAEAPAWVQTGAASPAQQSGVQAEDRACQYLQEQGARILARNVQTRHGEIDIVCLDAGVLAFVEVRQRRSVRYGGAAASVERSKQARLIRTAQIWLPRLALRYFGGQTPPCRFDVIAVQRDGIAWLKQAFAVDG